MQEPQPSPEQRSVFNQQVWEIARQIPAGRVATYGQIGGFIPAPEGIDPAAYAPFRARWVGQAMAACPADVPWQRVINAQGKISARGGGGVSAQRRLLEDEGVVFDARERIDLARFGWTGPGREWLLARGLAAPDDEFHQGALPI